jgi:integrase
LLTDRQCRSAQPGEKELKLFDQHGLYLAVRPTGAKIWKMKARIAGRETKLTFGPYPEVTITQAREKMWAARALIRDGIDPRKAPQGPLAMTFEGAARKWLALQAEGWKPKHLETVTDRIEADLFPAVGNMALDAIRPRDLVATLEAVQDRGGIEVAHRLRGYASNIFEMAIASDWTQANPAASIARALKPKRSRKYPALVRIEECRAFLRAIEAEPSQPATRLASRLLALTAARPGNVRWAQAHEFEGLDTVQPIWRIPAAKMKLALAESESEAFEFVIPLAPQTVELLRVAIGAAGRRQYLFPSIRHSHRPISENALSTNYKRVPGFEGRHVPHGWRSSFSTIMNQLAADEGRQGEREIIDLMLAHRPSGVEATYNRAAFMPQRRRIAQAWADLLLQGQIAPAELIEGPRKHQPAS